MARREAPGRQGARCPMQSAAPGALKGQEGKMLRGSFMPGVLDSVCGHLRARGRKETEGRTPALEGCARVSRCPAAAPHHAAPRGLSAASLESPAPHLA